MKARTNTGKQGAEKHVSMFALSFLFYRINTANSLSALVLLRDGSLIYWQPGLPAVFLDQSQKHQSGSKVQPSKTSSHSRVCSTRREWGKVFEAHRNSYEAESNNSKYHSRSRKKSALKWNTMKTIRSTQTRKKWVVNDVIIIYNTIKWQNNTTVLWTR